MAPKNLKRCGWQGGILRHVDSEEAAIQLYHQIESTEVAIGQLSKAVMRVHLNARLAVRARIFRPTAAAEEGATA